MEFTDTKERVLSDTFARQGISSSFECVNEGSINQASEWLLHLNRGDEDKTFKYSHHKRKLPTRIPVGVNFPDGPPIFVPNELRTKGYYWGEPLPSVSKPTGLGSVTVYEEFLRKLSVPETPNLLDAMEDIVYQCSSIHDYTYEEYCEEIGSPLDKLSCMNYYIEVCGYMAKFRSLGISMQELFDIFA